MTLSVILPTLNEAGNIGSILSSLLASGILPENREIIVVDDGSTDGTIEVVSGFIAKHKSIKLIRRDGSPSLPGAIYEGISGSKFEFLAWMDADGSMPVKDVEKMWTLFEKNESCVIGSRFVTGGGYKGKTAQDDNSYKIFKRIWHSQDSFLAIQLSRIMNFLIRKLIRVNVQDITSGFIIIPKSWIRQEWFDCNYGEYFLHLIHDLERDSRRITEVPYLNLPRKSGTSKTGTNLVQLLRRGMPYIILALKLGLKRKMKN